MRPGNLFQDLGPRQDTEREDPLLTGTGLRLMRILSWGQASPPGFYYDQAEDEWVLLAQGRARLRFLEPEECLELGPGDQVWLPAHRQHRVDWTDPQQACVWLALYLAPGSAQPPPCASS
ncbi:MAG: cupin domain-containing protein [Gammaproteobacteria bacterium]|nr:cupin domain-containing protein [Gammaproteobacteria bacterium]